MHTSESLRMVDTAYDKHIVIFRVFLEISHQSGGNGRLVKAIDDIQIFTIVEFEWGIRATLSFCDQFSLVQ